VFLFIFESIGTSELILVGIVALIFLGPRKMPQMARKLGKIMSEFRGTANEFKETWAREVNFDEEVKLLDIKDIEAEPVAREPLPSAEPPSPAAPEIKDIDPAQFEKLRERAAAAQSSETTTDTQNNDKKNWL
jgi:Tat protein translocase TatB subunit